MLTTDLWETNMLDNIPPIENPRPDPYPPLTAATWRTFWCYEYDFDTSLLTGYYEATSQITSGLNEMIDTSKSFDELKTELLNFVKERTAFMQDVDDKWNGPNPEQWGFPPRL